MIFQSIDLKQAKTRMRNRSWRGNGGGEVVGEGGVGGGGPQ